MAIHSHPFGSVRLTGDDASAFLRQIGEAEPPHTFQRQMMEKRDDMLVVRR